MKKTIAFLLSALMCAAILFASCGEETPEESITYRDVSELTSAPESVTSSENAETMGETESTAPTETEFSVDDLVLPEAVDISKCTIIPENFSDHSAQLAKLGYKEGSEEYDLYDLLLDISCQAALYLRYDNEIFADDYDTTRQFYWKYRGEIKRTVSDLLLKYDVGLAPRSLLPAEMDCPDKDDVLNVEYNAVRREVWLKNNEYRKTAASNLSEYFSSDLLKDYEYRDSAVSLLSEQVGLINRIEPYIITPLFDDTFEMTEEYIEDMNMVRITVTTSCDIGEYTYPGFLLDDGTRRSSLTPASSTAQCICECTENGDGTRTLTVLIEARYAFLNSVRDYYISTSQTIWLINKGGVNFRIVYHSNYPYFLYPGVDWDEPVRVQDEHLHTALTRYFRDLKGIEGYTRRDLSLITKLEIVKDRRKAENGEPTGEKYSRIYLYLATNLCKIYYPYYEENGERGAKGGLLPPASQYYTVEGEWIEDIPQSDMDLFIALGY